MNFDKFIAVLSVGLLAICLRKQIGSLVAKCACNFIAVCRAFDPMDSVAEAEYMKEAFVIGCWIGGLAILIPVLTLLMAPGYIVFFINHLITRLIFIGLFAWGCFGFYLLGRLRLRSHKEVQLATTIYTLVFVTPFVLAPMIGPSTCNSSMELQQVLREMSSPNVHMFRSRHR